MTLTLEKMRQINDILLGCIERHCGRNCPNGTGKFDCSWYNPPSGVGRKNPFNPDRCCSRMKLREYLTGNAFPKSNSNEENDIEETFAVVNSAVPTLRTTCSKRCKTCVFSNHAGGCKKLNILALISNQERIAKEHMK